MNRIKQDIAERQFNRIYLLYGEEAYLRNQYRDDLMKALTNEGDTMNVSAYRGKGVPTGEIIDLAETLPFLAEKRVILIEDSELFGGSDGDDSFCEYMKSVPDTTCIIFSEGKVDKRSKLYKAVKAAGYVAEMNRPTPDQIRKWIMGKLVRDGKTITTQAFEEFINRAGDDMLAILSEIEKLLSYTYGKNDISIADVQAICPPKIEDKIFEMLDDMMSGRTDSALELYGDLLELREAPERILFMIQRQIKMLIHTKAMNYEGVSADEIARILGTKPFAIKKIIPQAKRTSNEVLIKALDMCAQVEEDSKMGRINSQLGVELLIISAVAK